MSVDFSRQGDILLAVIDEPEMDYTNCAGIRDQLQKAAQEEGVGKLVLDLEDVGFMDSKAIGALVAVNKDIQGRTGNALILCELHPYVKKIISVVTLNTIFQVYEKREQALAAAAGS